MRSGNRQRDRLNRYALTPLALGLFPTAPANGSECGPTNGSESEPLDQQTVHTLDRGRFKNCTVNGSETGPEPDQGNQTKRTRKRPGIVADRWEVARSAMTNGTLDTEAFRAAWSAWATYRRESRKPLTDSTIRKQIQKLESVPIQGLV